MTRQERKEWLDKPTIAVYAMGVFGLEIKSIINGGDNDYIIFVDTMDQSVHIAKLNLTLSSAYFKYDGNYISLRNCLKCDRGGGQRDREGVR